jgi:hypothetical protein
LYLLTFSFDKKRLCEKLYKTIVNNIILHFAGCREVINMKHIGKIIVCLLVAAIFMLPISAVEVEEYKNKKTVQYSEIIASFQPTIEWNRTFGGSEYDMLYCVQETDDGGYIALGQTEESDEYFDWMLKLDSEGNEEWSAFYTDESWDGQGNTNFVQQTDDGGYIACTYALEENVHNDVGYAVGALWKVDAGGTTEWRQRYYASDEEPIIAVPWVVREMDDGYIAAGYVTYSDDSLDAMLMKTDSSGAVEWRIIYDYWDEDSTGRALCFTSDGGYLITGTAVDEREDFFAIKTDSNGNAEWYNTYGGLGSDVSFSRNCYPTSDGGYIINGNTNSYGAGRHDLWLVKIDAAGAMEWNKTIGTRLNEVVWCMDMTSDGGYALYAAQNYAGFSGTKDDAWLLKTDDEGNVEWSEIYVGPKIDRGYYVCQTGDGGYILSGRTESFGAGGSDGWLMKISAFENQRPAKPAKPSGPSNGKPETEYTFSTSTTDPDGDQLNYKWDWGDGNFSDWLGTNEATYSWAGENNYNVRVMARDEHGGESEWSDPLPFSTPLRYQTLLELIIEWILQIFGVS